jgi:hypothetical protein
MDEGVETFNADKARKVKPITVLNRSEPERRVICEMAHGL